MCTVFIQRRGGGGRGRVRIDRDGGEEGRRGGWGGREHASECPKPLEQGIFLLDWAIHSRHVTLNFFHYKTLLPSPLQRQIACTYFTQWNIASPPKQSFSSQSLGKKIESVIILQRYSMDFFFFLPLHRQTLCFYSNLSFQVRAKYYVCAKLYNYINYIDLKKKNNQLILA